ncbi:MAG: ribosomal RNA small subunit methyltransferase A [Bacilli bacterium]|nr:ribosomal RNA small subunit methyltransferase A [Bacilli bacterium]
MLSVEEIIDFFKLENSHAKKELGQNFLINKKACQNIVDFLEIDSDDQILEIGPGLGALTGLIVGKPKRFVAVEYDQKFVNFLEKSYKNQNVEIVKNNILKYRDYSFNKVIGNIPYYISSDIVEKICLNFEKLDKAILMVQKECFERITAKKGKDYNALNVLLLFMYDTKLKLTVSKQNFFPVPKVDSVVFEIKKKPLRDIEFAKVLYKTSKICFSNRRKTLLNNLSPVVRNKDLTIEILNNSNIKQTARAEELSISEFVVLTEELLRNKIF